MAAGNPSPSAGFSYAQAAKGRSSATTTQTPPSKVTSGAATPATGTFSELTSNSDWAEDVEASVQGKISDVQKAQQEDSKISLVKEDSVETVKAEEKMSNGTSGVSSPDLTASVSPETREDESSTTVPTAPPSESTSETKSQASEPAWISERKERQSTSQATEKPAKGEKKNKETTPAPAKPVILQDAPPPPVNPWQKRAEENKAKMAAQPKATPAQPQAPQTVNQKENQRPQVDSRKKANSIASIPKDTQGLNGGDEEARKAAQPKRSNEARNGTSRPTSKHANEDGRQDSLLSAGGKALPAERQSLPNLTTAPPPVKDQVAWPKPDTTPETERKDSVEKESEEKRSEENTPAIKRKKPEWTSIAVEPNIIWETASMNEPKGPRPRGGPSGERGARGGRGGNGGRGRGGHGGVPNGDERRPSRAGPSPNQDNETSANVRRASNSANAEQNTQTKANRTVSASPKRAQKTAAHIDRSAAAQDLSGTTASNGITAEGPTNLSASANSFVTSATATYIAAHRTKSPQKTESADMDNDEMIPKPIPRRNSQGTQTEETHGAQENGTRDGPPIRRVPSGNHKEARAFDNGRDATWTAPRGGKRGGRGRGGNGAREMPNGHSPAQAYGNGYADFTTQFAGHQSPVFQTPRGNHQYSYPPPGRGGGYRGTPRSPSLPMDSHYTPRFGYPYGAQPPVTPMQTYSPGMYDMSAYSMSAVPYPPQMEPHFLMEMVTTQVEYYFSIDNLLKDLFLRKNMDSQGFVFLDVVANFNRMKMLTQDRDLLKTVCINSKTIEIRVGEDGKERLRKREGWQQFLLPEDQREATARTSGPEHLERPERPHLSMNNVPPQFRGPASAGLPSMHQRQDRRSYDSSYPAANGYPPQFTPFTPYGGHSPDNTVNGEEHRGRTTKSPIRENGIPPPDMSVSGADESDQDVFPNDQISVLNVVVKTRTRIPFHSAASRTFSNGSIDSRSILAEMEKPAPEAPTEPLTNGVTSVNGSEHSTSLSRHASPNGTSSDERSINGDPQILWVKDQAPENLPSGDKLPDNFQFEPYFHIRSKGLEQREHAATGTCPYDLTVLYQFWCHFLIRNFNNGMYAEFKRFANEDAKERHEFTGLQNLVQFYSQSLSSSNLIPSRVAEDYVELAKNEPAGLQSAAYKSLRSAWRNGALNLKNRKTLSKFCDEALKEQLDKTEP